MPHQKIAAMLEGTDRRAIGRANKVARLVLENPRRFRELIKSLWDENPVLRSRAADAAEKVSAKKPLLLDCHKSEFLGLLAETEQIELRWHLAAMVPRHRLTPAERHRAAAALVRYLEDRSSIVKTCALQGLADLTRNDPSLRRQAVELDVHAERSGTAAMKARSRKLLERLRD